jgi:hypothetical protein
MSRLVKTGNRWNREKITVYGRALVVNTLMMPVISFRANVNGMTGAMTKKILSEIKQFVWKLVPTLKWSTAIRSTTEGGIGVRDPGALIDGMRVTLIKHLHNKADQPWAKWLRRKARRLSKEWGRENVYKGGVKKKQLKKLKETCVFESAIRVWHEIGGTVIEEQGQEKLTVQIGDTAVGLEVTSNRMIYNELIRRRFGELKENDKKVNFAMTEIRNKLTPKQREFWWRVAHKKFQTNKQAHKWKVDPTRGRAAEVCSVCKGPKEDWDHMEYECTGVQKWLEMLEEVYDKYTRGREVEKWVKPTRKEWRLEEGEEMTEDKMVVIAIARWLYHKERSALVHRQRRRLDVDRLVERVEEELEFLKDKERREEEKRREEEEKEKREAKAEEKKEE